MSFLKASITRRLPLVPRNVIASRGVTTQTRFLHPETHTPTPGQIVAHQQPGPPAPHVSAHDIAAEIVSGAPNALLHRTVRIYRPTKSTMQSAKGKTKVWRLDWDVLPGVGRWENELMGWASSADYMQGTELKFRTAEEAVDFAKKQGWDYMVQEPKIPKILPKNYANNYVHVPGKVRICHTK